MKISAIEKKINQERKRMSWSTMDGVGERSLLLRKSFFVQVILEHVMVKNLILGRKTLQAEKRAGAGPMWPAAQRPLQLQQSEQWESKSQLGAVQWGKPGRRRSSRALQALVKMLAFPLSEARSHWRVLSRTVTRSDLNSVKTSQSCYSPRARYLFW